MKAVVLAAGVGRRFGRRTRRLPKCLIPLDRRGTTLLGRYLDAFRGAGVREAVIVVGHLEGLIRSACARHGRGLRIRFVRNPRYREGSVLSLHAARKELDGPAVVMDADVFFPAAALARLVRSKKASAFLLDRRSKSSGEEMVLMAKGKRLWSISKTLDPRLKPVGEATGIVKFARADARLLRSILAEFVRNKITGVEYEEAYAELLKRRRIGCETTEGFFWTEMDFEEDLKRIRKYLRAHPEPGPEAPGRHRGGRRDHRARGPRRPRPARR